MARVIPEDFDDATMANDAERRVLRALAQDLSDEWLVLPSVSLWKDPSGGRKADFEIDVLLVHARDGMVVLEVKGYQDQHLEVRNGQWFARGRPINKDPVQQARSNAYELRDQLRVRQPDRFALLERPAYAVVLPNIAERPAGLPPKANLLTANDLTALDDAIGTVAVEQVLVNWDLDAMRDAIGVIAPSAEFHFDPEAQVAQRRRLLDDESRARLDALAGLDVNRRVYVWGGPGTGKTWLAETWARRAAHDGKATLLTCFNVPLAETLAGRLAGVGAKASGLTVKPFLELVADGRAGLPPVIRQEGEDDTSYWERVRAVVKAGAAHRQPLFDVIVVDEVQDFGAEWIDLLERLLTEDGRLLLVGDETQRTARDGVFTPPAVDDGFARCQLRVNLRNTKGIAQLLSNTYAHRAGRPRPGALASLAIEHRRVADRIEAAEVARAELAALDEAGVAASQTAVLTTSASWRDHLHETIRLRRWETPGTGVLCESVHRVKGLEFDTVVLVADGTMSTESLEPLLLIGVSRAVSRLIVVSDDRVASMLGLLDEN